MMRTAVIQRQKTSDNGTFGIFTLDDGVQFVSGELPWRNNEHGKSCIPPGEYLCKWITSPKHGECYEIMNVPWRDDIEIHSANWMGDASKGKLSQLLGCVALGKSFGILEEQPAILQSKTAISEFETNMKHENFMLTIKNIPSAN
jgi:hypothetical protein